MFSQANDPFNARFVEVQWWREYYRKPNQNNVRFMEDDEFIAAFEAVIGGKFPKDARLPRVKGLRSFFRIFNPRTKRVEERVFVEFETVEDRQIMLGLEYMDLPHAIGPILTFSPVRFVEAGHSLVVLNACAEVGIQLELLRVRTQRILAFSSIPGRTQAEDVRMRFNMQARMNVVGELRRLSAMGFGFYFEE